MSKRQTRASTRATRNSVDDNATSDGEMQNIDIRPSPVNVVLLRLNNSNNVIQLPVEACTNQQGMTVLQLGSSPLSAGDSGELQYIVPGSMENFILPHNDKSQSGGQNEGEEAMDVTESTRPKRGGVAVSNQHRPTATHHVTRSTSRKTSGVTTRRKSSDAEKSEAENSLESTQFTSLDDVYKLFLQYQLQHDDVNWTVVKKDASVFLYNVKKPEDVGLLAVQIKEDLEPAIMVYGKYLTEDHPLLYCNEFRDQLFNIGDVADFLKFIETYKLCPGNEQEETEEPDEEVEKNGFFNHFTSAVHSVKCQGLFNERTSKRCKNCSTFRATFLKKGGAKNANHNNISDEIKKIQTDKQTLKRKITQMKKKVEKLNAKLKRDTSEDVLAGAEDPKISRGNFLQLLRKKEVNLRKTKKSKLNTWHPAIIKWALNYHSQFAAAYDVLQTLFELPAASTLYNYSSEFPSHPGFSDLTILKMKQKIDLDQLEEHQKYFAIIIDEMKSNSVEDIADEMPDEIARAPDDGRVFVMMLEGLTTNYKHVFAYFPAYHMNADERYGYLQEGIEKLESNGFKILTVICDNSACNKKLIRLCTQSDPTRGVNNFKSKNTYAPKNEQRDIYYICDPTVLIKTARNGLTNSGANKYHFQYQKGGRSITWAHVRDMYKKDKKQTPRMCPKLTPMHIKVGSLYSQRVHLAVQVMSNSVAIAIESLIGEEGYETAKFISYFNRFFDMLNSRNNSLGRMVVNRDIDPYTSMDDFRFTWLEEKFLGYLYEWRNEVESFDLPIKEKRKMIMTKETLEPIIVTVHSAIETVKFLLSKGAPYVCTTRFTRDALENQYGKYTKCDSYQQ